MAVRKQRLPEPEELFLDYVTRMARHRDGREVLLVHMSKLDLINRTRHHVELVTTRLGQVARKFDGRVFRFVDGDIACVLNGAPAGHIDDVLFDIRYGFSTDLLVQAEDAGEAVFVERFDIRWDYESVEKLARHRLASFKAALSESMAAAEQDIAIDARTNPDRPYQPEDSKQPDAVDKSSAAQAPAKKMAGLVEVDRKRRQAKARPVAEPVMPIAGPLDQWMADNSVRAGGTMLPLNEILRTLPIWELSRPGEPQAGATMQIISRDLIDAYARASGMRMNERLESFLLNEAETNLVPLLGSLVSDQSFGGASSQLGRSVCLSPSVILSPMFLLAARAWQQAGDRGAIFWFDVSDLGQASPPMSYVADFLHDMGHLVGLRGLVPGDLGSCSAQLPQVDCWSLKWPEMDLNRAPKGEVDSLSRALEKWGAEHCFVQAIHNEDKAAAARQFGFRYTECADVASVKLFSRPF